MKPRQSYYILAVFMFLSCLIDLFNFIQIGPLSFTGITTIIYVIIIAIILVANVLNGDQFHSVIWPILIFCIWVTLTVFWGGISVTGIQNILAIYALVGSIVVSYQLSRNYHIYAQNLLRFFKRFLWVPAVIYLISLVIDGIGTNIFIHSRSFAILAAFGCAIYLVPSIYKRQIPFVPLVLIVLIGLSMSRAAMVCAMVMIVAGYLYYSKKNFWKNFSFAVVVILAGILVFSQSEILRERFTEGDTYQVGDVSINLTGRTVIWARTFTSIMDAPLLGQGAGSIQEYLQSTNSFLAHPHNDYLRIWHDYGLFGLCIFLAGILRFIIYGLKNLLSGIPQLEKLSLLYLLLLFSYLAIMITDNNLIFVYINIPFGILLGTLIGLTEKMKVSNVTYSILY